MPTYRIDLAYDGTGFHGYAGQSNARTVQGELERALFRRTGEVKTVVAGRTDTGVHASGQVVSFATDKPVDVDRMRRSLNRQLGPEIAVNAVAEVSDDFHARFSATGRRYGYRIWNGPVLDPLSARIAWHVAGPLDTAAMDDAVGVLVGTHDFTSFCRKADGRTAVREVREAGWTRTGDFVELLIVAGAFCHQMIRSIVAVSADIGAGRLERGAMGVMLEARDRRVARGSAPPRGLTLLGVEYDDTQPARIPRAHDGT